jgi:hypothetical protein
MRGMLYYTVQFYQELACPLAGGQRSGALDVSQHVSPPSPDDSIPATHAGRSFAADHFTPAVWKDSADDSLDYFL